MSSQPTLDPPVITNLVRTSLRLESPRRMTMLRVQPNDVTDEPAPSRQTMLRRRA